MKKKLIFLLLMAVSAINLYSQNDERAVNRIVFSAGLVGAEISYERVFSEKFSILASVSYNNWLFVDSLSISGKARYYPFNGTFFIDIGLGYSNGYNISGEFAELIGDLLLGIITFGLWFTTEHFQDRFNEAPEREHGFLIQPGMGWNFDIGRQDRFMLPVAMGLDIRISENWAIMPYFRIGLAYAF